MEKRELTEHEYWDNRWLRIKLPVEIKRDTTKFVTREMIGIFDRYLPQKDGLRILEIGGAPGRWLAYFRKHFHYDIHGIDYSRTGCAKMKENFDLLNVPATIYRFNILTDDTSSLPLFDIVYSFGLIEHFGDLSQLLEKHLKMLKEEGILMIGVPNFSGIAKLILQKTSPGILATHNLGAMDLKTYEAFEDKYSLTPLFKGYLGGLDPHNCRRCEQRTPVNRLIRLFFKVLTGVTNRISFLRRFNSWRWSPYLLVIFKRGQTAVS